MNIKKKIIAFTLSTYFAVTLVNPAFSGEETKLAGWQLIIMETSSVLIGGIAGGIIGAIIILLVHFHSLRKETVRDLLSKALAVQALKEAWILEGEGCKHLKLSENKDFPLKLSSDNGLGLRKVEIRYILDAPLWTPLPSQEYRRIDGKRTWIVRDTILGYTPTYHGASPSDQHPAIISSRGVEELAGWIEEVRLAKSGFLLPRYGLKILKPLLCAVCTEDRRKVFGTRRLSKEAIKFLEWYKMKYLVL